MCPSFPVHYMTNRTSADAKTNGEILHCEILGCVKPAYFRNLRLLQSRLRQGGSTSCPSLKKSSSQRFVYGIFYRPSTIDAISENEIAYSSLLRERHHGHYLSAIFQFVVAASIIGLLLVCGPYTVTGLVVSVIVNAVNGVLFGWSWSHVLHETLESSFSALSILPSVAHGNSSFYVAVCLGSVFVGASIFYGCPYSIFRKMPESRLEVGRKNDSVITGRAHGSFMGGSSGSSFRPRGYSCAPILPISTPSARRIS